MSFIVCVIFFVQKCRHIPKVKQLVTKHLNTHDKPSPREGSIFVVSMQNLNPSIGTSNALKINKNKIKLRKLWAPK